MPVAGTLWSLPRRAFRGPQAPVLTHLTWSTLMLRYLPPLFRDDRLSDVQLRSDRVNADRLVDDRVRLVRRRADRLAALRSAWRR